MQGLEIWYIPHSSVLEFSLLYGLANVLIHTKAEPKFILNFGKCKCDQENAKLKGVPPYFKVTSFSTMGIWQYIPILSKTAKGAMKLNHVISIVTTFYIHWNIYFIDHWIIYFTNHLL